MGVLLAYDAISNVSRGIEPKSIALFAVSFFGAQFGFEFLDSLTGFIIAIMICYFGFKVGKKNIDMLMDRSPDDELLKEIKQEAMEVSGVLDVHRVRARQLGEEVALDMHVDVDPEISVLEAHEIAHSVQKKLEELEEVESALVHICPYGTKIGEED